MTMRGKGTDSGGEDVSAGWLFGTTGPNFVMEAHDGLSAAVARRAGFGALWASGLTISTALGYRDANEMSWSTLVETVARIVESSGLPVLVDADSGFGNFNNARIVASQLQRRGAAGICIEDKLFPKINSFVGDVHPLAKVDEFCGRLRAVKDATGDFTLVARTEALIAGAGMDEALARAHAYADAGADGILIHSRRRDAAEVIDFARKWRARLPVVIVPTTYHATPVSAYREAGIATVIWANHSLRASLSAMRDACAEIRAHDSVASVETKIASIAEVFDLLAYDGLAADEARYLPKHS